VSDAGCPYPPVPRFGTLGSNSIAWLDLHSYGSDFLVVGTGGNVVRYNPVDGGAQTVGGSTCTNKGDFLAITVRQSDQAVFLTNNSGGLFRWNTDGGCVGVNALVSGQATTVLALDTHTFSGSFSGSSTNQSGQISLTRVDPNGTNPSTFGAGQGQVWEISGPDETTLFAAGWDQVPIRNRIWRWRPANDDWTTAFSTNNNNTPLFALDVPSSSLGFAAGKAFLQWDGAVWTYRPTPPLDVYGLTTISATELYAGGAAAGGRAGFAVWDGNTWQALGGTTPSGAIYRVRGSGRCGLVGVGSGGLLMTTYP
jgi:hypothetical protein